MTEKAFSPQVLPGRAVVRVAGDGALGFLHNLLTRDLLHLKPGEAAYTALLMPQGKILHDLFVVVDRDCVWLDCAASQVEQLIQKLVMYRLRAKLTFERETGKDVAVSSVTGLPGLSYPDPRYAGIGFRSITNAGSLSEGTGYDAARLACGLADSDSDIGSGEMFVHEANFDQLNGVSFAKGCYVGQEVVSRTHHRRAARSRILPVSCDGPAPEKGTPIDAQGIRIGDMLSSVGHSALALIRIDKLAEAGSALNAGGVRIHLRKPDWANFNISIPGASQ